MVSGWFVDYVESLMDGMLVFIEVSSVSCKRIVACHAF